MEVSAHPLGRLQQALSYMVWAPLIVAFGCTPNWIGFLMICYGLNSLRRAGFAEPYGSRFKYFWYVSLLAFGADFRQRLVLVQSPSHQIVSFVISATLSVATYLFIAMVCEIFQREQILPPMWRSIRTNARFVVAMKIIIAVGSLFYIAQGSSLSPFQMVTAVVTFLLYLIGWLILFWQLQSANSAAAYLVQQSVARGTVIPRGQPASVSKPQGWQFSLMTLFVMMLLAAFAVEWWIQPIPIEYSGSRTAAHQESHLRLHYAGARNSSVYIAILESSASPFVGEDEMAINRDRASITLDGTRIKAMRTPQLFYYDRNAKKFRRLKPSSEAMQEALNISPVKYWDQFIKPQLMQ